MKPNDEKNQKPQKTTSLTLPNDINPADIYGPGHAHMASISERLAIDITIDGPHMNFTGSTDNRRRLARDVVHEIVKAIRNGADVTIEIVADILDKKSPNRKEPLKTPAIAASFNSAALTLKNSVTIAPRNQEQALYLRDIFNHEVTFAVGPAGTGKTYLAIAAAVHAHENDPKIKKIVLCRPAVEAGEKLGFLPGDMKQKVDPYMQPLYDALYEMKGKQRVDNMIKSGEIEIAPLGFMRGRTLKGAFMVLDEAQNTTPEQKKMFLTRMGENSKIVVCGDLTQIDLPKGQESGLKYAVNRLSGVEGVSIHHLQEVVRHPMVAKMVNAFK